MNFGYPLVLLLLMIPVLMIFWEWTRREPTVVLPFDHSNVRKGRIMGRTLAAANLLPALVLAAAILVLAGPQRQVMGEQKRELTNIQFCLDVSGSMTAQFGEGSRYDGAMAAVNEFVSYRKGDAFGLTIFGNEVLHWVPITKDLSAIRLATPFLRPEKMPYYFGGTQIGKALMECHKLLLTREEGDRMIILVTDGYSADLDGGKALEVASRLAKDKIVVYVIQVGSEALPDEVSLIARNTGGASFGAGDPAALKTVFQRIDQMKSAKLKPPTRDFADYFAPFALGGLGAAALHLLCLFGLRYTPW